ncbi:MAG: GIY-YIG nuclease family protein [Acinetobacter sp.]
MKIELNWLESIELGSSSTLRENIKNLDLKCIPDIAGVYIFYREYAGKQYALYVGKSENIRTRMKSHFNSLSLIEGLEKTPQGAKKLIFAEVKTRSDLGRALNQAEKGLIQYYIAKGHPLLNKKLMADHFDEIMPKGEVIDLVNEEIWVYSTQTTR